MERRSALAAVDVERDLQQVKWGADDCSSLSMNPMLKLAVLIEEIGEVARALLEHDAAGLKDELTQVAAVAVAWLEALS